MEDVFAGPRGFYEVILLSHEIRDKLFNHLPVVYQRGFVHVVSWRPVVEYQDILKQECPVWVEVDWKNIVVWPLLKSSMEKLGKVLVPPRANSLNRHRMCLSWNTSKKRPLVLSLNPLGLPSMRFKLKWSTFAGHCFKCGELGHFMSECQTIIVDKELNEREKEVNVLEKQVDNVEPMEGMEGELEVQTLVLASAKEKGKEKVDMVREEDTEWIIRQPRRYKGNMQIQRQ